MIEVVKWISDEEIPPGVEDHGSMGGFFNDGMRWKDYLANCPEKEHPYREAIRRRVIKDKVRIGGDEHQYGEWIPLFSDGSVATFSFRGWGDLLAAIWSEEENKDHHYMQFYMNATKDY